jgi:hypothetical protein
MKKHFFGLLAIILAVGFSAFTNTKKATFSLYYKDSGGNFQTFTGSACPAGSDIQCQSNEPGVGIVPVYTAPNDLSPLMTARP